MTWLKANKRMDYKEKDGDDVPLAEHKQPCKGS
jgi:hypothetical protein